MGLSLDFSEKNRLHFNTKNDIHYVYKGIDNDSFKYPKTHDSVFDANCIKNSLHNILTFKNGEAILQPELGITQIYELMYAPINEVIANKIVKIVRSTIEKYEPRISITDMPMTYYEDSGTIEITINYTIPALNTTDQYQMQLEQ